MIPLMDSPQNPEHPPDLLMSYLPSMNIHDWVAQLGSISSQTSAILVGEAPYRAALYQSLKNEHTLVVGPPYAGPLTARMNFKTILESLVQASHLAIDTGLASLIDQNYYPSITRAFELLWEARFAHADGLHLDLEGALPKLNLVDSCDVWCLWFTLAKSNDLLQRVILPLDTLNEESSAILDAADRWSGVGCPLGILIGTITCQSEFHGITVIQ